MGRGHDVEAFWVPFLQALYEVDPDIAVNTEHEDQEFEQFQGLQLAAESLRSAAAKARVLE